jgi:hypothetical protein
MNGERESATTGEAASDRPLVFVSYSRKDADWRDRFLVMLSPVLDRELEVWSDLREVIGEDWSAQLEQAIGRSRAALLLVSPDFLASAFIMKQELPALTLQGATLVCVLVRPCLWKKMPLLAQVQWAHDPNRALSQEGNRDGAIARICERLIKLLSADRVTEPPPVAQRPEMAIRVDDRVNVLDRGQVPKVGARLGELYGVPALPAEFVPRDELDWVRDALLRAANGAVGVTGRGLGLGLHGQGGIGKTVLATAVARDPEICRRFPDGVFWVTVGQGADLVDAQRSLLAWLGVEETLRTATEGRAVLMRAWLSAKASL